VRKTLTLIAVILSSSATVVAQQHAAIPKETQCRTDVDAWIISKPELAKLSMQELAARHDSMLDCAKIDPDWKSAYQVAQGFYDLAMFDRVSDFLKRHDLWKRVLAEDAAGQR
jgi:hypothetical protein